MHWSRAGMIRLAAKNNLQSSLSGNRLNDSHRKVHAVEHRALLDMKFNVTERARLIFRFLETARVQTKIANRLSHGDAAVILPLKETSIQSACDCPAAEERHTEANAFFFRERHDLDSEGGPLTIKRLDQADSEHDTQHTIEGAGSGNRIEMRTHHKTWRVKT